MKKILLYIGLPLLLTACIKQVEKDFKGETVVEIDASPLNSVATGVTFPILTRIPAGGRPIVASADSTLRRFSGAVQIRVNLVGPQSDAEQTVGYKLFSSPVTSVSYGATLTAAQAPPTGQTPSRAAATLAVSDAVPGVHYTTLSGMVTIPANSSYGFITVNVLDAGPTAGQARFIGIQLDSTGSLKPNPNYNRIGLTIDQR